MIKLYNTLSRKIEEFKPINKNLVTLYTCGPTVYWYAHIGNLRTYIFEDVLGRVLRYNGYKIKHVMNITDVGHLTSDEDSGEDKMEKGARREQKTVWELASFYTEAFKKDLKILNIQGPDVWIKATDTIPAQIDLIKQLEAKGFTYTIADGVYFNTANLPTYGRLWPSKMDLKAGSRVEMVKGKKNPADFALWKLTPPGVKRQMEWDSPWGRGFPGWHTECVVMSVKELGIPFDIHCGGIDHILIHHTNELAQAEAVWGKQLCNFWLHGEFLNIAGQKIAKSAGNIITVADIVRKGINPLAWRYFCFTAHYRMPLNFSWEALIAAQNALNNLYSKAAELKEKNIAPASELGGRAKQYQNRFLAAINDDLNMPQALAVLWELVKDNSVSEQEKFGLMLDFDKIFGLDFDKVEIEEIPAEIKKLAQERENARLLKDFGKSDELRQKIAAAGWMVEDTAAGPKIKKI